MINKTRYIDKSILCKYDLSQELFSDLGIEVEDVIPLRKVFILTTPVGKKILKIVDSSERRLEFIDESLNYVSNKYKNILSYWKNKDGKIYKKWNGNTYVILDMIEGREATFSNPIEISICAKAIAGMHNASKGIFKELDNSLIQGNVGCYLPKYFEENLNDMLELKNYVSRFKYRNKFDELFLENVDYNINYIKKAKELLALSNYNSLLEDDDKRVLCHNDLAHHNFIIDGEDVKIIDFDYCNIDTRVVDLVNYTSKVIKNLAYDSEKAKLIIESYNKVNTLTKDEVKVFYALITFPRDFVTSVKDYYYSQKTWEEEVFLNRFRNKLSNEVYRREFLDKFIENFKDYLY
ncbi:CotS family spore coat protein [Clostridium chauvoei]|uniref:Putative Spore coat protein, CotS family n=1 Tax=Clostridium chauvoei JF4335 TaxID=1351755 RepID=A0A1U6JPN7_9CLOT|nr:CotS family spore coat protein [Clostridium chauvoei]SLK22281.1 Putative Spore coat protein, CotS family [Clostridium chauvoei JF4335]